ncbi:MAG: selenium cofactor biosynthesis protein YqeC [Anaerolineae bacterium]|nr:selenium cofactor biosynthesis protein YqeC [Anaerolineae bacterium]MDK1080485.1 selenium cofactor biosynthesis protein YqeC [Anaerolineae bacterium]
MNLLKALRLPKSPIIAFVGAGGKTTALFQLARQLDGPVIVTATSHLGAWQIPFADRHIITKTAAPIEALEHSLSGVILVTGDIKEERLQPLDNQLLIWLHEFCQDHSLPLLIEADGSRGKPLKAPAEHEPAIPEFVALVVQVVGLSGLGQPVGKETIHRPELFTHLSELQIGETVTTSALVRFLKHPEGGLKNIPTDARRIVLLNKADTPELQSQADSIATKLFPIYDLVVIASLIEEKIHAVRSPIAGIVLAAGESRRFGQPKQLLNFRGEPFVRRVAKTALASGLSPVLVIKGAHALEVEQVIQDLPIRIIHNDNWRSGQASSIRSGINQFLQGNSSYNKSGSPGAAIFLLADQPQISPSLIQALVDEHALTFGLIIAPMILDQRANPVLFDRDTFRDLAKLKGDIGGRHLFSKYKVNYLPWQDEAMLLDVDTPDQYQKLKDTLE